MGGFSPSRRDQLRTHHQDTIVIAGNVFFDEDRIAFLFRGLIGRRDLCDSRQIGGDSTTLIAVLRLDDDSAADVFGRLNRIFQAGDGVAFWNRQTNFAQQSSRQLFVLRDLFRDGSGGVGLCRLNFSLLAAFT